MKHNIPPWKLLSILCYLFLLTLTRVAAQQESDSPQFVFIKAGRLIDVRAGKVLEAQGILIEGERIKEVGPLASISLKAPKEATVIDLSNATVLPGLIDCHTHVTSDPGDYYEGIFRKSSINYAVEAHIYARRTLEAGFTTIRDLGAAEFIDVALRNAISSGKIPGPRMQVSTLDVGATGGHNDLDGFSPYVKVGGFSGVADGIDEIRKLVRFEVKNGADIIKLIATGGVLSEEESATGVQYSQEEMNAVVLEAAMWGKKVAAHAHGTEGIKRAIRAGVISIEHGSMLDDEAIALMKARGTFLVCNPYTNAYIEQEGRRLGLPQKSIDKSRLVRETKRESLKRAIQAGVRIAYGTDAGTYPHGQNAKQFSLYVQAGLTPMQAIQSATVSAAELLGWQDRVGSIATGMFADIIAVKSDPLKDITVLESVDFVMKGGAVVKNRISQ
jgi:imidazolonepropionase-like amidohydrolase